MRLEMRAIDLGVWLPSAEFGASDFVFILTLTKLESGDMVLVL